MTTIIGVRLRAVFPRLRASLMIVAVALSTTASGEEMDRDDATLAYAQCMRENGFTEFPDPSPDGRMMMRVTPESAPRFESAAKACKNLAPPGWAGDDVTPEQVEALLQLAQCIRDNGVPEFPDPNASGTFNLGELRDAGVDPSSPRVESAMQACSEAGLRQGARIRIGG